MPAPTVEEKVRPEPAGTKPEADSKEMQQNDTTPNTKDTAHLKEKETNGKDSTEPTSNVMTTEKVSKDTPTERATPLEVQPSPMKDEAPAEVSNVQKAPAESEDAQKAASAVDAMVVETVADGERLKASEHAREPKDDSDAITAEKPKEAKENENKPEASMQPPATEKPDAKSKANEEQPGHNAKVADRPRVRFGSVEELPAGEDDEEYEPSEDDDGESNEEQEEEGEINEGDEPTLDLKGIPQSLAAALLEKGVMNGPLHGPATRGNVDEVRALLAKGGEMEGKVDDCDLFHYTSLHLAAEADKVDVCKLLIEHGADIEASTKMHDSKPIHYAAFEGHDEVIALLLEKGANINALTDDNRTALYQAAMRGHQHCVKLLLEKGADRDMADKDGKKPAHVAEKQEIVDLLTGPPTKKARTE